MFVPPDQRSVPPPWEPPQKPSRDAKRAKNAAVTLIILISILGLFAPIAGGTLIAVIAALFGH